MVRRAALPLGVGALVLAGCATPMTPAQQETADIAQCVSFDAGPGTPKYPDCRMFLITKRQVDQQQRSEALAALGKSMQNAGQAMSQASPKSTHTTCNTFMGSLDCTTQ